MYFLLDGTFCGMPEIHGTKKCWKKGRKCSITFHFMILDAPYDEKRTEISVLAKAAIDRTVLLTRLERKNASRGMLRKDFLKLSDRSSTRRNGHLRRFVDRSMWLIKLHTTAWRLTLFGIFGVVAVFSKIGFVARTLWAFFILLNLYFALKKTTRDGRLLLARSFDFAMQHDVLS